MLRVARPEPDRQLGSARRGSRLIAPVAGSIIHEIADELGESDQAGRGAPTSIQVQPTTKACEDDGPALKHRAMPRTPEPLSLC